MAHQQHNDQPLQHDHDHQHAHHHHDDKRQKTHVNEAKDQTIDQSIKSKYQNVAN